MVSRVNRSWVNHNPAAGQLVDLGVIHPDSVTLYHDQCRDADVKVLRCQVSGVIFLESAERTLGDYYQQPDLTPRTRLGRPSEPPRPFDDPRREAMIVDRLRGRRWVDVGSGSGSLVEALRKQAIPEFAACVEPNENFRREIVGKGIACEANVYDLSQTFSKSFDVATMFHVLEHLHSPAETLRELHNSLRPDASLIVEVPHARDILLETYDSDAFRNFTLWSEHLVLHTRASLRVVIEAAGFEIEEIVGIQRYPLANHLYWLSKGMPGGQVTWPWLSNPELDRAYLETVRSIDQTDTLMAIAHRGST